MHVHPHSPSCAHTMPFAPGTHHPTCPPPPPITGVAYPQSLADQADLDSIMCLPVLSAYQGCSMWEQICPPEDIGCLKTVLVVTTCRRVGAPGL